MAEPVKWKWKTNNETNVEKNKQTENEKIAFDEWNSKIETRRVCVCAGENEPKIQSLLFSTNLQEEAKKWISK